MIAFHYNPTNTCNLKYAHKRFLRTSSAAVSMGLNEIIYEWASGEFKDTLGGSFTRQS